MSECGCCLRCGACCRGLIIEAYWHDVLREPRLLNAPPNNDALTAEDLKDGDKCVILGFPCTFLCADNLCAIYPTRPNTCVGFEGGGEQCRQVRQEPKCGGSHRAKDERR